MGVAGGGCYHIDIVIIHIHIHTFVVPRVALSRSLRRSRLFYAFWSLARSFSLAVTRNVPTEPAAD
jgi:hypothetical protein